MELKNINRDPVANAREDLLNYVERIQKKSESPAWVFQGRRVVSYLMNVDVKGSNDRPTGKVVPVYRDHVGRLTLEPLGQPVGALLRGGYCGQACHVGILEEVSHARSG